MNTPGDFLSSRYISSHRRTFLKSAAAWGIGTHLGVKSLAAAARDDVRDVALTPQLFLDDQCVESIKGLERQLHRPAKQGLIQEADGRPWELGDPISVVRDVAGRFHMTYRFLYWDPSVRDLHPGIGEDKAHWYRLPTAYATSDDGIRWTKPVLGLVDGPIGFRRAPEVKWKEGVFWEPTGISRRNNLGCPIHTMQDLNQFGGLPNPRRRYLINVLRLDDTHAFANVVDAGLYFAADVPDIVGDPDWRKRLEAIWEGPRRGPRGQAVRVAGFDPREQIWFDCTQASFGAWRKRGGRDIARFTTRDLKEWSAEELVLPVAADEPREPQDWIEYMDIRVMRVADFWLGQLIIFHGDRTSPQYEMPTAPGVWRKGTTEMRLVLSRDAGKSWRRVGGKTAWLPHHEADDGYDRLVFTGSPVRVGDELWLYYGCWDGDHLTWNRDGTTYYKDRVRIGRTARAVLRWDGYVSLSAGESPGELTTKPLTTTGRRLEINATASKGSVRVELQDADGKPFPGFALAECDRCTGDGVSQPVRWRSKAELPPSLGDRPLRLRFEVHQADLYGFRFRNADEERTGEKAKPEGSAMLIEPADLERKLDLKGLRILDTRPKGDYSKGHIPGAVWLDVATWQELGKTEGGFHNAKAWADNVGQLGIEQSSHVVVYGSRLPDTARIWWTLKYLGLGDVAILDGGWEAWAKEKRPTETTPPKVNAARFEPKFQADRLEEIDSLKASIRSGKVTVVDARSPDEFTGKEIRGKRGGHIPKAKLLEWTELLAPDGRFKTPAELRELFRKRGILPDDNAVCY